MAVSHVEESFHTKKKLFPGLSTSFHLTPLSAQIFAFSKWEGQRVASDVSHAPA